MSHINAFRDYRVRADKFQLSKCNAKIHTGFCVGGGEGGHETMNAGRSAM